MKAFRYRLDPALRWRATELRLEQEKVSVMSRRIAALQDELMAKHNELRSGSLELTNAGSAAFDSWGAYVDRCRRRMQWIKEQLRQSKTALAEKTKDMVEAHRRLRILENMQQDERTRWEAELGRETEALAAEAFLAGLQRNRHRHAGTPQCPRDS